MVKINLILIVLTLILFSCQDGSIEFSKEYTLEKASESIIEYMLNKDSSIIIYGMPTKLEKGIHLLNPIPTVVETLIVEDDSWLFIADHNYPYSSSIFGSYMLFNIYDGQIYGQSQHLMPSDLSNYKIVYPTARAMSSKDKAKEQFLHFLRDSKAAIFMYKEMLKIGDTILVDVTNKEYTINKDSWFFIVDRGYIRYNIPRTFGYFLMDVSIGLVYSNFFEYYPPTNFSDLDTIYYKWRRANRRLPNLNFTNSSSHKACCNFLVYIENEDETALIRIRGDTTKLNFINDSLEFNINDQIFDLEILLYHYFYLPVNYFSPLSFKCNDTGGSVGYSQHIWYPTSGKMIIQRSYNQYNQLGLMFEFNDMMFKSDSVDSDIIINFFRKENIVIAHCPG